MRKIFSVVFALLYATLSTGAPALLHYCGHEEAMHLSIGQHDHKEDSSHTEAPVSDCCHASEEISSCHNSDEDLQNDHHIKDNDNCCTSASVTLDNAQFETAPKLKCNCIRTADLSVFITTCESPALSGAREFVVRSNGPPLYLKYSKLVLYS